MNPIHLQGNRKHGFDSCGTGKHPDVTGNASDVDKEGKTLISFEINVKKDSACWVVTRVIQQITR